MTFKSVGQSIKRGFLKVLKPKTFLFIGTIWFGVASLVFNFIDVIEPLEALRASLSFYIFLVGSVILDYLEQEKQ